MYVNICLSVIVRYVNIIWFKKILLKSLPYLSSVFMSCVVCFPSAMITYSVGAVVDFVSEGPLEVEEQSFRSEGGLNEKFL